MCMVSLAPGETREVVFTMARGPIWPKPATWCAVRQPRRRGRTAWPTSGGVREILTRCRSGRRTIVRRDDQPVAALQTLACRLWADPATQARRRIRVPRSAARCDGARLYAADLYRDQILKAASRHSSRAMCSTGGTSRRDAVSGRAVDDLLAALRPSRTHRRQRGIAAARPDRPFLEAPPLAPTVTMPTSNRGSRRSRARSIEHCIRAIDKG